MQEAAVAALLKTCVARLASGTEIWGNRVYADAAPAGAQRPYVVLMLTGGPRNRLMRKQDAEMSLTAKVISPNLTEALNGLARLSALLDDAGEQDGGTMTGTAAWRILTTTAEQFLRLREMVDGAPLYHEAVRVRIIMEEA
jgi:hypothetical protein